MHTYAIVLAGLLLLPAAANAQDTLPFELQCERDMKPSIEVLAHPAAFDLNDTIASKVLNTRATYGSASQLALGLTAGTARSEVGFDGPSLLDPQTRRECIAPKIWVELSYSPLAVYVAREFNRTSCPYRVVYAHEMEHVRIYRENLPLVQQRVRAALAARYGDRPLYAPAGEGLRRLQEDVDGWLRPLIRAELARVQALQVAHDSQEEVFRLSHACHGEVGRILGSSL